MHGLIVRLLRLAILLNSLLPLNHALSATRPWPYASETLSTYGCAYRPHLAASESAAALLKDLHDANVASESLPQLNRPEGVAQLGFFKLAFDDIEQRRLHQRGLIFRTFQAFMRKSLRCYRKTGLSELILCRDDESQTKTLTPLSHVR